MDREEEQILDAKKAYHKSGQSVIEFCIGLVAILTVIAGIFQLGLLIGGRTTARVDATGNAAVLSLQDPSDAFVPIYPFIGKVEEGDDEKSYSADDEKTVTGVNDAYQRIVQNNQTGILRTYAPGNDYAVISNAEDMQAVFGLVRARSTESNIPILPIVRKLFINESNLDIEMEVWSVRTGGLY